MTQHIRGTCGLSSNKNLLTILYEDSTTCIVQIKRGYIKRDRIEHISQKLFYTHDFKENGDITIQQICSKDNLAKLFTKSLPTTTFEKLVLGMRRLRDFK